MLCTYEQLLRLIRDDDTWSMLSDDYSKDTPREQAATNMLAASVVLAPNEHTAFILLPRSETIVDLHLVIGPEGRGKKAIKAAREAMAYIFENSTFEKITAMAPADNRPLGVYARACGFRREGTLSKSLRRGGQLIDQHIYSFEKERF
jgi:hypothetical protein